MYWHLRPRLPGNRNSSLTTRCLIRNDARNGTNAHKLLYLVSHQQNHLTQSRLLSIPFSALNSKYPLDHLLLPTPRLSSTRIVRHEGVQVAVVTTISSVYGDMVGLNPVFCHRYSIQACAARKTIPFGMLTGCEALETKVSRILRDGNGNREGTLRLPAPRRLGARVVWYG